MWEEPRVVRLQKKDGIVVQGCDLYIGRRIDNTAWSLPASKWRNPFRVTNKDALPAILAKYRQHILKTPGVVAQLRELSGKTLGCWCKPGLCHGDVLVDLFRRYVMGAGPVGDWQPSVKMAVKSRDKQHFVEATDNHIEVITRPLVGVLWNTSARVTIPSAEVVRKLVWSPSSASWAVLSGGREKRRDVAGRCIEGSHAAIRVYDLHGGLVQFIDGVSHEGEFAWTPAGLVFHLFNDEKENGIGMRAEWALH